MSHPLLASCARTARTIAAAARAEDDAAVERALARLQRLSPPLLALPAKSRLGRTARAITMAAAGCVGDAPGRSQRARALARHADRALAEAGATR